MKNIQEIQQVVDWLWEGSKRETESQEQGVVSFSTGEYF